MRHAEEPVAGHVDRDLVADRHATLVEGLRILHVRVEHRHVTLGVVRLVTRQIDEEPNCTRRLRGRIEELRDDRERRRPVQVPGRAARDEVGAGPANRAGRAAHTAFDPQSGGQTFKHATAPVTVSENGEASVNIALP